MLQELNISGDVVLQNISAEPKGLRQNYRLWSNRLLKGIGSFAATVGHVQFSRRGLRSVESNVCACLNTEWQSMMGRLPA